MSYNQIKKQRRGSPLRNEIQINYSRNKFVNSVNNFVINEMDKIVKKPKMNYDIDFIKTNKFLQELIDNKIIKSNYGDYVNLLKSTLFINGYQCFLRELRNFRYVNCEDIFLNMPIIDLIP